MTNFFRSTDAAEIFALEHRCPFAGVLITMVAISNILSTVLMLMAIA